MSVPQRHGNAAHNLTTACHSLASLGHRKIRRPLSSFLSALFVSPRPCQLFLTDSPCRCHLFLSLLVLVSPFSLSSTCQPFLCLHPASSLSVLFIVLVSSLNLGEKKKKKRTLLMLMRVHETDKAIYRLHRGNPLRIDVPQRRRVDDVPLVKFLY